MFLSLFKYLFCFLVQAASFDLDIVARMQDQMTQGYI